MARFAGNDDRAGLEPNLQLGANPPQSVSSLGDGVRALVQLLG